MWGPGGPGDSGVDRVKTGMCRFSQDLQDRFDIVSFDPRGIARSNPVKCSAALLAKQPSPIIKSQAEFDATIRYNRQLASDCRDNTGPVYDHIDTWQTVRDVDAIRGRSASRRSRSTAARTARCSARSTPRRTRAGSARWCWRA